MSAPFPLGPSSERPEVPGSFVARIAEGDRDAFAGLYDRLAPIVTGMLRRRGMGERASAVALEDLFTRIWREAPRARRSETSDTAWLLERIDRALQALHLER